MDIHAVSTCSAVLDISHVHMSKASALGVEVPVLLPHGCCNCCCFVR